MKVQLIADANDNRMGVEDLEESPGLYFVYIKQRKGKVLGYFSQAWAPPNAAGFAVKHFGKKLEKAGGVVYVTPAFHKSYVFRTRIQPDESGMSRSNQIA